MVVRTPNAPPAPRLPVALRGAVMPTPPAVLQGAALRARLKTIANAPLRAQNLQRDNKGIWALAGLGLLVNLQGNLAESVRRGREANRIKGRLADLRGQEAPSSAQQRTTTDTKLPLVPANNAAAQLTPLQELDAMRGSDSALTLGAGLADYLRRSGNAGQICPNQAQLICESSNDALDSAQLFQLAALPPAQAWSARIRRAFRDSRTNQALPRATEDAVNGMLSFWYFIIHGIAEIIADQQANQANPPPPALMAGQADPRLNLALILQSLGSDDTRHNTHISFDGHKLLDLISQHPDISRKITELRDDAASFGDRLLGRNKERFAPILQQFAPILRL